MASQIDLAPVFQRSQRHRETSRLRVDRRQSQGRPHLQQHQFHSRLHRGGHRRCGSGIIIGWYKGIRLFVDPLLSALNATPRGRDGAADPDLVRHRLQIESLHHFSVGVFPCVGNIPSAECAPSIATFCAPREPFCASDWQIFKTVAIPGSVPFILTGVRQGVALGLIGVVVGEMFGGSQGIGFMVAYGGQTLATDTLFVGVTIIAAAGILLTWLAERLERRFSRWRPER